MENLIYIAEISLDYDNVGNDTKIHYWSRERYARALQLRKRKAYSNSYFRRVTEKNANEIQEKNNWNYFKRQYDKSIMEKYNVGPDYKENRWFMEQVRPTIN